ncbi:MAG: trypsin-like peptidase domain-containing protein [Chitinispirillia bacterium]|nr:trypsin-like peptidase domain-containing protein [Chitinispirillia bacterium]
MRSIFFAVLTVTLFTFTLSAQDQPKHPSRGSIKFGASAPPVAEAASHDLRSAFVKISEQVVPAVVAVMPVAFQSSGNNSSTPQIQGIGSGIIISKEGHILTNYHVVAGADSAMIRLHDETLLTAVKIGADSLCDLAVLRLTGPIPVEFPVAFLGNSDSLHPGDWVAAIGSPFNLSSTITAGIVSALGRTVELDLPYQYFIQTDAAINPGNSGGALVDLNGAVVGVNSLILSPSGGSIGIGFAIPINMARRVAEELVYEGKVARGFLGVETQNLTPILAQALNCEAKSGAVVTMLSEKGPASKSGLEAGDVIVSLDEHSVTSANEFLNLTAAHRPNTKVKIKFFRGEKKETAEITLAAREKSKKSNESGKAAEQPPVRRSATGNKCGVAVNDINEKARLKYGLPKNTGGVLISAVTPGILDERAALMQGDILTRIKSNKGNWTEISSKKSYQSFSESLADKDIVVMQILRSGQTLFVSFEVANSRKM